MSFKKRTKERAPTADSAYFMKFVRVECCNYSQRGPFGITDHCIGEPRITGSRCLVAEGYRCLWFERRVLPAEKFNHIKALHSLWSRFCDEDRIQRGLPPVKGGDGESPAPVVVTTRLCQRCACRFQATSNRQKFCDGCGQINRRRLSAETSRKHRKSKVESDTFADSEVAVEAT